MEEMMAEAVLSALGAALVWQPNTRLDEHKSRWCFWARPRARVGEMAVAPRGEYVVIRQRQGRRYIYIAVYYFFLPGDPRYLRGPVSECGYAFPDKAAAKAACESHELHPQKQWPFHELHARGLAQISRKKSVKTWDWWQLQAVHDVQKKAVGNGR